MAELDTPQAAALAALKRRFEELVPEGQRKHFATELKISEKTLSDMLTGKSIRTALRVLIRLRTFEDHLHLPPGDFLQAMGFVDLPNARNAKRAVETDSSVDPVLREVILVLLDHFRAKLVPAPSKDGKVTPISEPPKKASDRTAQTQAPRKAASGAKAKVSPGKEAQLADTIAERAVDDPGPAKKRGKGPKT